MRSRKTYACTNFLSYKLFFTVQKEDDLAVRRLVLASGITQVALELAVSLTFRSLSQSSGSMERQKHETRILTE
jgi:hypothetical protein